MVGTFIEVEREGWNARADVYFDTTARATTQAIPALLAAVRPRIGTKLLDICTGPGFAAGAAAAIGCQATGVDFAEEMVRVAAKRFPSCRFVTGDAQDLKLKPASFDAVTCNFGVFHFSEPERALREAARVLKPGGRYAWSQWQGPDRSPFFGVVFKAISTHADMDLGLPPAPPPFRFSDVEVASATMTEAGFEEIAVTEVPIVLSAPARSFMDFFRKFSVRVVMLLDHQTESVRKVIENEIQAGLSTFLDDDLLHIPMPAIVVSGEKPG